MSKSDWSQVALDCLEKSIVLSWMFFLVLCAGCQKSDSQYREITEESSSTENSIADAQNDDAAVVAKSDDNSQSSPDNDARKEDDSQEMPADNTPQGEALHQTTADVSPELKNDTTVNSEPPSDEASDVKSAASPDKTSTQGTRSDTTGIVSLQAEMDRKKREQLLKVDEEATLSEPREIKLLVEDREFSKESKHDAWRVTFDDIDLLKILNMEPVPLNAEDYLPEWLTALEGQRIILRGWMFPPNESEGIRRFMFVRDNQICCFGRKAKVYDKLWVKLQKGETSKYIQGRPFDLVGTFKIESWPEDERDEKTGEFVEMLGVLYHIEDATIISK